MTEKSSPDAQDHKKFITGFPVYYGWVIMAVGTLGMIMTSPGQTYTESIFIEFIIQDLTISRSLISTLYAFGTLIGGFSLPFWGKQIDRLGTRKMVTLISFLFGLSCIFMGFVQGPWMIGLGFILVRMLGQGSLGLVSQTAINHWWMRKRGMIMGISGLMMALLGMGAFPNLVYWLISSFEWRLAYIILGVGLLVIMVPSGYLFFRERPEDFGLSPDGVSKDDLEMSRQVLSEELAEENWTLKEALKTRTFWIVGVSFSMFALLITGITFHLVSIFQTQGLEPGLAATVFLPIALTAAVTNMLVGYLSDHMPLRYLIAIGLLLQSLSLVAGLFISGPAAALLFGIVLGATNGVARAMGTITWPTFFGRKYLGSIYGFTAAMSVFGAAIGPLPFGFAYDLIGSYQPVLVVFAGICLILSLLSLTIRKPQKANNE